MDFLSQDGRELLDGLRLEDGGQPQPAAERLLDLADDANREQRMPAQFEEFVFDADRVDAENALPDAGEFGFNGVLRAGVAFFRVRVGCIRAPAALRGPPCRWA